jgi:hypothetical protein
MFSIAAAILASTFQAATAQQQQQPQPQTAQGLPIVLVPAIIGNILAVVSFLIGTSSFILGLRIQSAARTTTTTGSTSSSSATLPSSVMHKYFELLILALVNRDKCIWNTSSWKPLVFTRCSLSITPFCSLHTRGSDIISSQKVTYCI